MMTVKHAGAFPLSTLDGCTAEDEIFCLKLALSTDPFIFDFLWSHFQAWDLTHFELIMPLIFAADATFISMFLKNYTTQLIFMSKGPSGQVDLMKRMLSLYRKSEDGQGSAKEAAKYLMCYCYVYAAVFFLINDEDDSFALSILGLITDAGSIPAYAHFKNGISIDDFKAQLAVFKGKSEEHGVIADKINALIAAKETQIS